MFGNIFVFHFRNYMSIPPKLFACGRERFLADGRDPKTNQDTPKTSFDTPEIVFRRPEETPRQPEITIEITIELTSGDESEHKIEVESGNVILKMKLETITNSKLKQNLLQRVLMTNVKIQRNEKEHLETHIYKGTLKWNFKMNLNKSS